MSFFLQSGLKRRQGPLDQIRMVSCEHLRNPSEVELMRVQGRRYYRAGGQGGTRVTGGGGRAGCSGPAGTGRARVLSRSTGSIRSGVCTERHTLRLTADLLRPLIFKSGGLSVRGCGTATVAVYEIERERERRRAGQWNR